MMEKLVSKIQMSELYNYKLCGVYKYTGNTQQQRTNNEKEQS